MFHPTSSQDCRPLAGSPAWLAVHAGAGHHLLLREGKLTSPVPDYTGQRSEVWEQSHSDKTLGEEKPGQEEEVKGEAADLLRASFACCCCTCYQCPSVPLTPGKGVAVSLAPSIWVCRAIQKGENKVRYLFSVLALTRQARLSSSVRREGQQGLSAVGPHLMGCLRSHTPVAPTARLSCATSPRPNSLCLMKRMAVSSVSTPSWPGQAGQALAHTFLRPWKLDRADRVSCPCRSLLSPSLALPHKVH